MTTATLHRTRPRAWEPSASRLTAGPVVLGAALTGVVGYALALWFAHEAVYAERVEEERYCSPAGVPAASAP